MLRVKLELGINRVVASYIYIITGRRSGYTAFVKYSHKTIFSFQVRRFPNVKSKFSSGGVGETSKKTKLQDTNSV